MSSRLHSRRQIAFSLGVLHHVSRRPDRKLAEARALSCNPAFQLRGATRYETAVEERTAIQLQGLSGLTYLAGLLECHHVTPYRCGLELNRVVTMAIEDSVTELAAEKAQRLPQGPTGMRRVELGPKQRNDGIAAGTGSMNGEISEKGEALRLSEDGVDRASVGPLQVQRPQHAQLDHTATAAASAPTGGGQVTLQSRLGHWPALASSMYARRRYPPE